MAEDKKETREKLKLTIPKENRPRFESMIETAYTSSSEFCDEFINPVFRGTFVDYFGSKIEVTANRMMVATLAFSELGSTKTEGDSRVNAIERVINEKTMHDVDARIQLVNKSIGANRYQNQYRLTQNAKDVLEAVVPYAAKKSNGEINWKAISGEGAITDSFNFVQQQYPIIQVQIDLSRFAKLLYGGIEEDTGGAYQYMVNLGGPINPVTGLNGQLIVSNWQLFIMRLPLSTVEDIARKYGVTNQNNMGYIR